MFQSTRPLGRDRESGIVARGISRVSIHAPVRARPVHACDKAYAKAFQSTRPLGRDLYVYIIPKNLASKRRAARNKPIFRPKIKRRKKAFLQRLCFNDLALARNSRKKDVGSTFALGAATRPFAVETTASLPRTRRAVRLRGNKGDASLLRITQHRNSNRQTSQLNHSQCRSIFSLHSKISVLIL